MTTVDESPNYHRVAPRAPATAPAAAEEEGAADAPLRAQPHARARVRQMLTGAVEKGRDVRASRRAAIDARGAVATADAAASTAGRGTLLDVNPPSLRALTERAQAGPTRPERLEDGSVVHVSLDYPDWQMALWSAYAWGVVALAVPFYALWYCVEKPSRCAALAGVVALVVFLVWFGSAADVPPAPAAGQEVTR